MYAKRTVKPYINVLFIYDTVAYSRSSSIVFTYFYFLVDNNQELYITNMGRLVRYSLTIFSTKRGAT